MTEFMTDDKERFVAAGFFQGGIPDDHAFGSTQAGYIGIDLVALFAGAHQEDALSGDRYAGVRGQPLNGVRQLRMVFIERLKFMEQRIEDQRVEEDDPQQDRQGGKPEVQPPPPRTAANHRKENQDQDRK